MSNTEAKYGDFGEPWQVIQIGEKTTLMDCKGDTIDSYPEPYRTDWLFRVMDCLNAFSGHDPSDSVVLKREEWRHSLSQLIRIAESIDKLRNCPIEEYFATRDFARIAAIDARSALAAAERGRG